MFSIRKRWRGAEQPHMALPFLAGLMAGILFVYFHADSWSAQHQAANSALIKRLGTMELDTGTFFWYVLRKRLAVLWTLAILATTFAGMVTTYLFVFWAGISAGVMASTLVLQFGIKGGILFAGGLLPQYLCYIPAFLMMFAWCMRVYLQLYGGEYSAYQEEEGGRRKRLIPTILIVHGVVITGVFLESYVNPNFIAEILKIF
ncbi:MAG: stage II sporulation protein M [Lachnospiraceae bacterium]|nr:stage II sporulation protein M [Lachnospiraceae bacterium]